MQSKEFDLKSLIQSQKAEFGYSHWGHTKLNTPLSMSIYKDWLEKGFAADMDYLKAQSDLKEHPQALGKNLKSALVFSFHYLPHPKPSKNKPILNTAKYAHGDDYHFWIKDHLNKVVEQLKHTHPEEEFLCFTDSHPVLERDLAYRAGLGWVGKNSCLIDPKIGSFFLIGEIYTSLEFSEEAKLSHDFCGTCNKCVESCPTQAINDNKTLDANKCISYWTIESQSLPPAGLRSQFKDLFFGCDICQDVCPWNQKIIKSQLVTTTSSDEARADIVNELRFILASSYKNLMKHFEGTPLIRSRGFGLKRNALMVIANLKLKELQPDVEALMKSLDLSEPKPQLINELSQWTLQQLQN